jgi:hypothetical protein
VDVVPVSDAAAVATEKSFCSGGDIDSKWYEIVLPRRGCPGLTEMVVLVGSR